MTISNSPYSQPVPGNLVASGYSTTKTSVSLKAGSYIILSSANLNLQPLNGGGTLANFRQTLGQSSGYYSPAGLSQNQYFTLLADDTVEISGSFFVVQLPDIPNMQGVTFSSLIYDGTNYQFSVSSTTAANLINGRLFYSTDLLTWQTKTTGATYSMSTTGSSNWNGANTFVYNANVTNKYVWCGNSTSTTGPIWTSTDSVTWTSRNLPAGVTVNNPFGVCINSATTNKYILLSRSNVTNPICYSTDGVTWTNVAFSMSGGTPTNGGVATNGTTSTNEIYVISYNNSVSANSICTSTDGVTWTNRATGQLATRNVIWFANKYWIFRNPEREYATSTDGVTWTLASPISYSINDVFVYENNLWIDTGSGSMIYTTDGTTFTNSVVPSGQSLRGILQINGAYWLFGSGLQAPLRIQQPFTYSIYSVNTSRTFS